MTTELSRPAGGTVTDLIKCPGCATLMVHETRDGVTVDHCGSCDMLWFDATELDRHLEGLPHRSTHPAWEVAIPERGLSAFSCPRCSPVALRSVGWSGLVLWRCPQCHGLLMDMTELPIVDQVDAGSVASGAGDGLRSMAYSAGLFLLGDLGFLMLLARMISAFR